MGSFGQFLLREGKLLPSQLNKVMEMQQLVGGRVGTNILELGLMREQDVLDALGTFRKIRTVSAIELRQVPRDVLRLVPPKIAQRHGLIPVERRGNTLIVASQDSVDPLVEDELGYLTSCLVRTVLCLELRLHWALERYYRVPQPTRMGGLTRRLDATSALSEASIPPSPPALVPTTPTVSAETASAATASVSSTAAQSAPPAVSLSPDRPASPDDVTPSATARVTVPRRLRVSVRDSETPPKSPSPSPTEIQYIELDEDTRQRIYTADPTSQTPAARLDAAAEELQSAFIRDEIGDVLLAYCKPYFTRRLLLIQRKGAIVGWRGEGTGVEMEKVRAIATAADEPSVFLTLQQGADFWLGPLAPLKAHNSLHEALAGQSPGVCLVLPITLRRRIVCYLYGDNGDDGAGSAPLTEIRRLATKAGVAFEVCILQNKIRTL